MLERTWSKGSIYPLLTGMLTHTATMETVWLCHRDSIYFRFQLYHSWEELEEEKSEYIV